MDFEYLPVLILLSIFSSVLSQSPIRCHPAEKDAILRIQLTCQFEEAYSLPDCCSWYNVECDNAKGNVIRLQLNSCVGNNTLSPDSPIFELRHLQVLYVANYDYSLHNGTIPNEIGKLTELQELYLGGFRGLIPSSIGNLTNLETLSFRGNNFSGTIPPSLGNLSNLTYLVLEGNQLTGTIPASFGNLHKLGSLILNSNKMSALDLSMLKDMEYLRVLEISSNEGLLLVNSKGPFPPYLAVLYIDDCHLTEFPIFLSSLPNLLMLSLRGNKMRCRLNISKWWPSLVELDVSFNLFYGVLTAAPLSLQTLNLSRNIFIGDVPAGFCNLKVLDLSFNRLNGVVLWNTSNCLRSPIEELNLRNNYLHGSIPNVFSKLRVLLLNGNRFGGKFPSSLGNCTDLMYLDVGNNNITDTFPGFLGNLKFLYVLVISSNHFTGNISATKPSIPFPFRRLLVLDASNNKFSGLLPMDYIPKFNNFTGWEITYGSSYNDKIFITFKGSKASLSQILSTEGFKFGSLDLSNNEFSGSIPNEVGNMKNLTGLNLNGNNLSGEIPMSFRNMINLKSLDLSSNMLLTGNIPGELLHLRTTGYLNLSNNKSSYQKKYPFLIKPIILVTWAMWGYVDFPF